MKYRAPVEGVKIKCSDATYKRLKVAALASWHLIPTQARETPKKAIGFWCEANLWTALEHRKNYPLPQLPVHSGEDREFEISENLDLQIEQLCAALVRPKWEWIASVVLRALAIEETRLHGVAREPDRFA